MQMSQLQGPESVFVDGEVPDQLVRVHDNQPSAKLHAKWWGKSMSDEEKEWRRQYPDPNALTLSGGSDHAADRMDVDSGDIGSGWVINIGVDGLRWRWIWVRSEYIKIYDYCNEHYEDYLNVVNQRAPCAVVTGQPGIGKSLWIYYAIRRRLSEGKAVVWYFQRKYHLFVEDGVYELPEGFDFCCFKGLIWTLVDSDSVPPSVYVIQDPNNFLVLATSPEKSLWSPLDKTTSLSLAIMDPWTEQEVLQVASLHKGLDIKQVKDTFDKFGPTARLCIDYVRSKKALARYETDLGDAIKGLTIPRFIHMMQETRSMQQPMDSNSHKIFLVLRTDNLEIARVELITDYVASLLTRQWIFQKNMNRVQLLEALESVPPAGGLSGHIFEALGHHELGSNIDLELFPMVKQDNSSEGQKLPRWYSSHELCGDNWDEKREGARKNAIRFKFTPYRMAIYEGILDPGVYYLPKSRTQAGLDAFILIDGILTIFQFTVSSNHDINPKMANFLKLLSRDRSISKRRFVFVTNSASLTCPQTRNAGLEGLQLFSVKLDTED